MKQHELYKSITLIEVGQSDLELARGLARQWPHRRRRLDRRGGSILASTTRIFVIIFVVVQAIVDFCLDTCARVERRKE